PTAVCPSIDFTLNATGMTIGTGIEYQWQYDDNGTWTDIVGATNAFYTVTGGITTPTDYRFITTCTNGGAQDISPAYTVAMEPFYNCYCTSYAYYVYDGEIYNVTLGSLNNTSTCDQTVGTCSMINQYSDYTAIVPATPLMQLASYPFSVTAGACDGFQYVAWVKAWIDFNQDGIFDDSPGSDELVFSGTTTSGYYTPAGDIAAGTVSIPASALPGVTRMRVILWQSTTASTVVPCDAGYNFYYGETEDYLVEIMAATSCAGQPDPVTISGPTAVCPSIDFTLNATGMTIGTGIEYQWQYDDNGTWTDIVGATNAFYTVTGGITTPT